MAGLREVRKKIKSVKQTQQVTKAMKMIAAARLKKFQAALLSSRPYAFKIEELVEDLLKRLMLEEKPLPYLLRRRTQAKDKVLVVFTSDKGLCGSFNVVILREVLKFYEEATQKGGKVHFFAVGRKGRDFFVRQGFPIAREFTGWRRPSYAQAEILAQEILEFYRTHHEVGEVVSLFTDFKSLLRYKPAFQRLLPASFNLNQKDIAAWERFDFLYEPDKDKILEALLPRALTVEIYRHLLETSTSEQASRMNVMENATKNAGEMIEGLSLLANKIRQASITREILEVVSGAEALV